MIEIHYSLPDYSSQTILTGDPNKYAWREIAYFDPEPVLNLLAQERDKNISYLQCPAFTNYYKNCYLIRCPFDLTISLDPVTNSFRTNEFDQEFYDKYLVDRVDQNNIYRMLSLRILYLFYSEHEVLMQQISPSMHKTELINNINIIHGEFDISKWIRPVEFSFEIVDKTKPLILKRGDPLFYIRFATNETVKLIRSPMTEELNYISSACLYAKDVIRKQSLNERYESAKSLISSYKDKIFGKKSKCPFSFLRRK
jgi:hypothetical protein